MSVISTGSGPRCPLGDRCSNKRFTKKETHPTSVFKTELKGYGLRADVEMPENAFIYEYVGEVSLYVGEVSLYVGEAV